MCCPFHFRLGGLNKGKTKGVTNPEIKNEIIEGKSNKDIKGGLVGLCFLGGKGA